VGSEVFSAKSMGVPAESLDAGSSSLAVSGDLARCPVFLESADGSTSQVSSRTLDAEGLLEVGEDPMKEVVSIPACSEIAGGSFSLLDYSAPASLFCHSGSGFGADFSGVTKSSVSVSLGTSLSVSGGVLVDWAGSGHSGSLFIPNYSPSLSSMDLGPSILCSGLENKNGLESASLPVVVQSPLSCCPGLKVKRCLGKTSPESLLEMVLDCSPPLGISYDGSKDQFSGLLACGYYKMYRQC
jgi:hypothetical protein